METYLDLTKGLHTDFEPINQPMGTYRYLKDAIRQLSGAIENEKGTKLTKEFVDTETRIVGSYVLDSDTIFFSYSPTSQKSEIGILNTEGVYSVITNDTSLAFSLSIIIRAEGRRNFKGERIIYFVGKGLPMRVLNIDAPLIGNFDDNTKLVLSADMPQISTIDVREGGTLPTGVYQFATRLLTKSTNATSVSILTNIIPVIDEDNSSQDLADGALPQSISNKAISLTISNIDTDYEFIEVIAITYIGTGNISNINIIARLPIQSRDNINFTYSNTDQIKESLDVAVITAEPSAYDSAEFIIQKDGILVFAGLSTKLRDFNFQSAANMVTLKYVIKEEIHQENISILNGNDVSTNYPVGNDYKNVNTIVNYKSYRRDEVYSFAISPIYQDWSSGFAYHIPAPLNNTTANTATNTLATYKSAEIYPVGKGYPAGVVRHHKMPTIEQEPHFQVRNNNTYVRMLGVSFDLTQMLASIPDDIKKTIIGWTITKQKRTLNNSSVLSQGIAVGHQISQVVTGSTVYAPIPFAGHFPAMSLPDGVQVDNSIIAFYSPESILYKDTLKNGTSIKPVMQLSGTSYVVGDKRTSGAVTGPANGHKYAYVLLNYSNATGDTSQNSIVKTIDTNFTQYVEAGAEDTKDQSSTSASTVPIPNSSYNVATWRNPGYLFMKISNGNLPAAHPLFGSDKAEVYYKYESGTDGLYLNGTTATTNSTGTTQRHLYNITRTIDNQYGSVLDAKYHYVKHTLVKELTSPLIECFNGDTFITKFAVMSSMSPRTSAEGEVVLKGLSYFWVESSVNTGFRHYKAAVGVENTVDFVAGTVGYYPKVKILHSDSGNGLFDYSTSLGHPIGYNKQYSFENVLKQYYPTPIGFEVVSEYGNRLIYSDQSVEGEQLDAFRILLPNNYHDIPKERGKITNLFLLENKIYVHTERSLWKTYFNEQVSQISSSGEVYLGNGGVFYRPSTQVMTVTGGYAGTKSSSGTTTPFGHFFVDETQRKSFMFSTELKEISDQGMFKYFRNNLEVLPDTPALGIGYSSVFDYEHKRWLITKIGQWTLAYSVQLNSWSSFHSYTPYHYISNGDRVYSTDLNTINSMFDGIYGSYYGSLPTDMRLEISINDAPSETKTIDNLVFNTTSQNVQDIEQHYDTWNTLQISNTTRNTGKCRLVVPKSFEDEFIPLSLFEAFCKLKSNEFRVAIPSDLVIDVAKSIFDVSNLSVSRIYQPRVSGKYFVASLSYNNLRDNRFILHNIGRLFRQRIR